MCLIYYVINFLESSFKECEFIIYLKILIREKGLFINVEIRVIVDFFLLIMEDK